MNDYNEKNIGKEKITISGIELYTDIEENEDTNTSNESKYIMAKITEEYLKCLKKKYNQKLEEIEELRRNYEISKFSFNSLYNKLINTLEEQGYHLKESDLEGTLSRVTMLILKRHKVDRRLTSIERDFLTKRSWLKELDEEIKSKELKISDLEKDLNDFKSTYIFNHSNINPDSFEESIKNILAENIITNKFIKNITSYSIPTLYAYAQNNSSNTYLDFESFLAYMLHMGLKDNEMLDLSNYYSNYIEKLRSIVDENQNTPKVDYSKIKKIIINEYKKELVSEYNSIISQKMALNESHNLATSTIREFNETVAEKGINARIQYSYNISFGIPIAIAVIFNNLFGIPLKDEYEDYTSCNGLILNPIDNIKKLMLLYKIRTMTDEEWELLRVGIIEHEDNNDILIKIGELEDKQDEYLKNYIYNRFNINHNILVKVVYKLYNEGIITDEFLHSPQVILNELLGTRDDIYISNGNEITSTPAHLAKFINYLESNMAYDSDFMSSNISVHSDTKKAIITNQKSISLPRTRIIL